MNWRLFGYLLTQQNIGMKYIIFVSSDRSSYSETVLLYNCGSWPLFQIFTQPIDAIVVTSVTLSRLNSINAFDVTRC